jgi:ubiquinone/menaquinone biosynthesis C-methylase UbiE
VNILAHKFDTNHRKKLDNEKRRQEMPPLKTLETLGYTGAVDLADIGCGIGYFTIPAAEIAGAASKIYAMDISDEMLDEVEKEASEARVSNIHKVKADEYDLKLEAQAVGFAIMVNVLHEIENKKRFVGEILRILQSGGKLAIIEWEKIPGVKGPAIEERISFEEAAELLKSSGFESTQKLSIGQSHYAITAIKK